MTNNEQDKEFTDEMLRYREWKREEVAKALVALETAAWARRWADLKTARARIELLTGLTITGPFRRELEKARKESAGEAVPPPHTGRGR